MLSPLRAKIQQMKVVCLAGGVGGAKLVDGLAQLLPAENLTIIGNTGDDFIHWDLTICPDLDTVMYTLAGVANPETGWGRMGETWRTLEQVGKLGGEDWFRLGDLDLATHLVRSDGLRKGWSLTEVTAGLCRHFSIPYSLLPMCDTPAPTLIETTEGLLSFQEWFVRRCWQPVVKKVHLPDHARATHQVAAALSTADLVIFAPSNPFVSIDPILNVYPIREMIADLPELVVAVSPIVAGTALKGPAAKMMQERHLPVTSSAIADYYGELIDLFVYDQVDAGTSLSNSLHQLCTNTIMHTPSDRLRLATEILQTAATILTNS